MYCRTCRGPVQAGYARCYQCDLAHARCGGLLADVVAPVAYAVKGGRLADDLWRYKSGAAGATESGERLAAMLTRFLRDHGEQVCRAAGMTADPGLAAVVPSGQGRPGAHPLAEIVAGCVDVPIVPLSATAGTPARGRGLGDGVGVGWLSVGGPVAGADVLLIDDTWVSGGSGQSAAAALKTAGARRVALVVLGRHVDPADPRTAEFLRIMSASRDRRETAKFRHSELSKRTKEIAARSIACLAAVLVNELACHYFADMQASQIVAALRANSTDAPGELFDAYGEQLIAYCWQSLRSVDATLIAVRDTIIVAEAHADRLRDPELLEPWLLALARAECQRRLPAAARKTGAAAGGGEGPPPAAGMRDEILACIDDPEQARYRTVAAGRVPPLGADGFPTHRAAITPRWPRRRGRPVKGGLLTAGVAAAAALILIAAGASLRGGARSAAPVASGSAVTAPGSSGPGLDSSSAPQVRRSSATALAQPVLQPVTSDSQVGQNQLARYEVGNQVRSVGRLFGGQVPVAPPGLPPMEMPAPNGRSSTSSWRQSGRPWQQQPGPSWQPSSRPAPSDGQPGRWASPSSSPAAEAAGAAPSAPRQPTMQSAPSPAPPSGWDPSARGGRHSHGPGSSATFGPGYGQPHGGPHGAGNWGRGR